MRPTAERSYSKLEWFFYIIFLPILFLSILTITLLWFLDFDVKNKMKEALNKIPVVEKIIDDEQFNNENYLTINNSREYLQNTITELKKTLDEKNQAITNTETKLTTKDVEIQDLQKQIEDLDKQLKEKNMSEKQREEEIKDQARIYANMSTKSAASIISNLSTEETVLILGQMSTDAKSKILEKMDPKVAADLSILLKDAKYTKDQDIKALQERINSLLAQIDQLKNKESNKTDYQQLALTYSAMEPKKAAQTILAIAEQDLKKAQDILVAMDPASRSIILSNMEAKDAANLTIGMVD